MAAQSKSNELRITRVYDAPVAAVWDAWTDPEQVGKWWGPRGFTLTTRSKDLRAGGTWVYTMHGPDGTDYPNKTVYHVVEPHSKLVYDHGGNDDRPPLFRVTVVFSEIDGKTRMDMSMALPTPEAAEETRAMIRKAGGESTWDRLAEYLEKEITGKDSFVINRTFAAPIETVFAMWTEPEHLKQWLPPAGFDVKFIRADIRSGGSAFCVMNGPGGVCFHGIFEYLTIEKPDRITYKQHFCDANEKMARHPMAPIWPPYMLNSVKLVAEGPEQTRVTLTTTPMGTAEEIAVFLEARGGMTQGWTGSFDKLEARLAGG